MMNSDAIKTLHKKVKLILRLALFIALLVGSITLHAEAKNNTVDFVANVKVISDRKCAFTITPPALTTFSATWNKKAGSNSRWTKVTDGRNSYIKVAAHGHADCTVNGLKIASKVHEAIYIPGVDAAGGAVPFGNNGGYWVVVPQVADAKFYLDDNFTAQERMTVEAHTEVAKGSNEYWGNFRNGPGYIIDKGIGWFSKKQGEIGSSGASRLSDSRALPTNALGDTTSFKLEHNKPFKSAAFGVAVLWGANPIDADGRPAFDRALDGDTVNATFTMTVIHV